MANQVSNLVEERRRRRSNNPLVATRYQLEQVIHDFELDLCLIATEDGRLFASTNDADPVITELFAAIASDALKDPNSATVQGVMRACGIDSHARQIYTQEFWAWEQPMIMLAIGELAESEELDLFRAILGVRRITRQALYDASA